MRKWKISVAIAALAISLALSVSTPRTTYNFYETAQLSTVLVDVPDGWGSGFVIKRRNSSGTRLFVWTAGHVVDDAPATGVIVFIRTPEGNRVGQIRYPVIRTWRTDADAALLQIEAPAENFPDISIDADRPALGQPVFAVGNHHGSTYDGTITVGIVSQFGVARNDEKGLTWDLADQTTAEFNRGSSGGPVFSEHSHGVIGIAVGTSGNGINVYLPSRAIARAASAAGIGWAVTGETCPEDAELRALPIDVWTRIRHLFL